MHWLEAQAALKKIIDPEQQTGTDEIRGYLKSCRHSLESESGFEDFPEGVSLRPVPYNFIQAQQSVEDALTRLDAGDRPGTLQFARAALTCLEAIPPIAIVREYLRPFFPGQPLSMREDTAENAVIDVMDSQKRPKELRISRDFLHSYPRQSILDYLVKAKIAESIENSPSVSIKQLL